MSILISFSTLQISFYTINSLIPDEVALADGGTSGELEIENFFVNEVEIRRKDLLPVFNHFQKNRVNRSERLVLFIKVICVSKVSTFMGNALK